MLARSLRDAVGAPNPSPGTASRSIAAMQLEPVLRQFEMERSQRVLKISVRSFLMGAALQVPFAPVRDPPLCVQAVPCWQRGPYCPQELPTTCLYGRIFRYKLLLRTVLDSPGETQSFRSICSLSSDVRASQPDPHNLSMMQIVAARNYAAKNLLPVKDFLDHASYDCGTL